MWDAVASSRDVTERETSRSTALALRISQVSCAGKGLRQSSLFLNIAHVRGDAMAILRNAYIAMAQLKCNKVARPLLLVPHAPRHHSCTPQQTLQSQTAKWFRLQLGLQCCARHVPEILCRWTQLKFKILLNLFDFIDFPRKKWLFLFNFLLTLTPALPIDTVLTLLAQEFLIQRSHVLAAVLRLNVKRKRAHRTPKRRIVEEVWT